MKTGETEGKWKTTSSGRCKKTGGSFATGFVLAMVVVFVGSPVAFSQCDPPLPPPPPPPDDGGVVLYSLNGQTGQANANGYQRDSRVWY